MVVLASMKRVMYLSNLKVRNNTSSDQGGGIYIEEQRILNDVDVLQ